jgi:Ankyrin repeats (many copies)
MRFCPAHPPASVGACAPCCPIRLPTCFASASVRNHPSIRVYPRLRDQAAVPLHDAAAANDVAALRELLDSGGADVEQRDAEDCTALHWAADRGALGVGGHQKTRRKNTIIEGGRPWGGRKRNAREKNAWGCIVLVCQH